MHEEIGEGGDQAKNQAVLEMDMETWEVNNDVEEYYNGLADILPCRSPKKLSKSHTVKSLIGITQRLKFKVTLGTHDTFYIYHFGSNRKKPS